MTLHRNTFPAALLCLSLGTTTPPALAHCLIVGSADARVQAAEGTLVPVATSRQCESLRLLTGTATAMWTQVDGRPGAAAVRPDRAPEGYTSAINTTPQERLRQALAALVADGAHARAGYKRFDNATDISDVYADPAGIGLPWTGPGQLQLSVPQGRGLRVIATLAVPSGQRALIPGPTVQAFALLRVEFNQGQQTEAMVLRRLPPAEQNAAAQALQGLAQLQALTPREQAVARAMVFENLGLSFQRDMALLP